MITIKTDIARNATAEAVTDLLNSGSKFPNARLYVYDSDRVTKLFHLNFSGTAFTKPAVAGVINAAGLPYTTLSYGAGTATWYSANNRDNVPIWSGDVTDLRGSGSMRLASTAIVSGLYISIQSIAYTVPE